MGEGSDKDRLERVIDDIVSVVEQELERRINADLVNIYFVSLYLHGHTKNKNG
ncbi:MAG: hypothetical protein ACLUIQ_02770 [Dialister invisus]